MSWRYDPRHRCFCAKVDGWRLVVQQTRRSGLWRAAVVIPDGLARIAPALFASKTVAQTWCIAVLHQQQPEGATGS
jgi:hypothetical protein